jgi:hypothetical protein
LIRRLHRSIAIAGIRARILAFLAVTAACSATPLPQPPSVLPGVDPTHITLRALTPSKVQIEGSAGAIEPHGSRIRVTWIAAPPNISLPEDDTAETSADGAFGMVLTGTRTDFFFFEVLEEDADVFVVALTGGPGDSAIETDAGPDADGDGSPDAIDCAPNDPTAHGQRCP